MVSVSEHMTKAVEKHLGLSPMPYSCSTGVGHGTESWPSEFDASFDSVHILLFKGSCPSHAEQLVRSSNYRNGSTSTPGRCFWACCCVICILCYDEVAPYTWRGGCQQAMDHAVCRQRRHRRGAKLVQQPLHLLLLVSSPLKQLQSRS